MNEPAGFEFIKWFNKFQLNDYEWALLHYDRALQLDPNHIEALGCRWLCRLEIENYKWGMEDYMKRFLLKFLLDEKDCSYRKPLGVDLIDEMWALNYFNQSIELDLNNIALYKLRWVRRFQLWYFDSAMQDLHKALEINPSDTEALMLMEKLETLLESLLK